MFLKKYIEKRNSFAVLFWNYFFAYIPLGLLVAILSLVDVVPVNFNDQKYTGIQGAVISFVYVPWVAFVFALLNWIFLSFGNFVLRFFVGLFDSKTAKDDPKVAN